MSNKQVKNFIFVLKKFFKFSYTFKFLKNTKFSSSARNLFTKKNPKFVTFRSPFKILIYFKL